MMLLLSAPDFSLPLKNPVLIFSLILFIILFAPLILNKLRIPHLIGLIIAGALIGPNGFNLMERDMSIILFGTVGLLYIMFLAGLEIDLAEFKKNSGKSLYFGLLTFLIPMVLGIVGGLYLLNFSISTSVLLASMFASHTLIAYPIVSKLGATKDRAVNITVGGTMITDTLALLVLAVIVGMTTGEINDEFWIKLGVSVLVFGLVIVFIFPLIGRWFFKRFEDNISQYIFVLGMVFLGGFLAELAGIEHIIGAFLVGLALNRLIPRTSPLMNRIEFVGNALFIPFFLIGVGMLIDYRAFFRGFETIKVASIMTLIAIVAKFLAAFITQKTFKFSIDQRRLIFGLSSAQAAATLAAVLVGFNIFTKEFSTTETVPKEVITLTDNAAFITTDSRKLIFTENENNRQPVIGDLATLSGSDANETLKLTDGYELIFVRGELTEIRKYERLLNESVLNGTILMILITCTIGSFVAQKGAQNIALAEASEDDVDLEDSNERILISLNNLEKTEELINLSVTVKSAKNKKGMFALNVIEEIESTPESDKIGKKILDKAAVTASATDNRVQELLRYDLNIVNGISSVVKEHKITDLILGVSEKKGISKAFFGDLTEGILTKCNTTTLIYKPAQPLSTIKRHLILIPDKAEKEIGFPFWLIKVWNIAKNTGAKLVFYSSQQTLNFIKEVHVKHPVDAEFIEFIDWNDFLIISRDLKNNDNLIVILSRRSGPSYNYNMNKVPTYLNKYFENTSYILIYPIQSGVIDSYMNLKNPSVLEPFQDNLDRLEDIKNTIAKLFKKK
jgi:Kef-type K+ transport system membrane component KefB/nucleotide-binding universal stress UspA family protein